MSDFRCISADSHVVEPPNLWLDHIDSAYRDRAPRIVSVDGNDAFDIDGVGVFPVGGHSAAGRKWAEIRRGTFAETVSPGAYDPDVRLEEMARDGLDAELLYPTVAMRFFGMPDPGLRAACFRAYNDWVAAYAGAHPDRLKAIAMIPLDDIAEGVAELHRAQKLGLVAAAVGVDQDPDQEQYDSPAFDQFWAAAQELDMSLSLHVVTNGTKMPGVRTVVDRAIHEMWIQRTLAVMIFGGVFLRFPDLRMISAEHDAGWAPYFMSRLDYLVSTGQAADYPISTGSDAPSDYFRRNVVCTFMRDRTGVLVRDQIGLGNLMWGSDYPHFDSTFPNSQQVIDEVFAGVPDDERLQMIAGNAERIYGF